MRLTIFIDLDGVLADFVSAALDAHALSAPEEWPLVEGCELGRRKSIESTFGISKDDFWSPIHVQGEEFWLNLAPLSDGVALFDRLRETYETKICTTPSHDATSSSGKVLWMQQQFGSKFRDYVIAPEKWCLSHSGALLIDDHEKNIVNFRKRGGNAWLFPRPWNSGGVVINNRTLEEMLGESW